MTAPAADGSRAVGAATIAEAFRITAEDHPDRVAVRTKDDEVSLTWAELRERVDALARGLHELGVGRGDTVAIMLANRPEFHIADLAAMSLGATPFSIYATSSPEQIAYVVGDAKAKVAIVEEVFAERFAAIRSQLGRARARDRGRRPVPEGDLAWADVEATESSFDVDAAWRAVEPEDLITLIYTSGTTGPPKGVQLVHRNLMAATKGVEELIRFPDGSKVISWLPAAHIAERMAHHYLPIVLRHDDHDLPEPARGRGVPAGRQADVVLRRAAHLGEAQGRHGGLPGLGRGRSPEARVAGRGDAQGRARAGRRAGARGPRGDRRGGRRAAVRRASGRCSGFDEIAAVNVGAAPTPREVLVFFHAIGVPLAELWGMSETCGAGACNPPEKIKIGTVGPADAGRRGRLAEDGELLIRSDVVMTGYRNLPDRTAEALDADGWLHTGDIATIDDDGYITIVDRKKELIINAAGKNMSPANIESELKGASPLIGQACVIGDARSYNTALIVLDADFAPAFAAQNGMEGKSLEAAGGRGRDPRRGPAGRRQGQRPALTVEQIKTFTILEGDWAPGGEELTPTMKLKRRPIAEKYASAIESMYAR